MPEFIDDNEIDSVLGMKKEDMSFESKLIGIDRAFDKPEEIAHALNFEIPWYTFSNGATFLSSYRLNNKPPFRYVCINHVTCVPKLGAVLMPSENVSGTLLAFFHFNFEVFEALPGKLTAKKPEFYNHNTKPRHRHKQEEARKLYSHSHFFVPDIKRIDVCKWGFSVESETPAHVFCIDYRQFRRVVQHQIEQEKEKESQEANTPYYEQQWSDEDQMTYTELKRNFTGCIWEVPMWVQNWEHRIGSWKRPVEENAIDDEDMDAIMFGEQNQRVPKIMRQLGPKPKNIDL